MPFKKKRGHEKCFRKAYSTATWGKYTTSDEDTDPEQSAEIEYAREHGWNDEIDHHIGNGVVLLLADGANAVLESVGNGIHRHGNIKKNVNALKNKQPKADRKARGRGVSGCMCKKDKRIAFARYNTLMDLDVYYGQDNDDSLDYDFLDSDEYYNTVRSHGNEENGGELPTASDMNRITMSGTKEGEKPPNGAETNEGKK